MPTRKFRLARCGCGALTAQTRGEPAAVYLCTCRVCQLKSGSAFSYAAVFPEGDVTVRGDWKTWRNIGESGRWVDNHFCPVCGVSVFFHSEGLSGTIGVRVGCFAENESTARDAALAPQQLYWASRKREWVCMPEGIEAMERQ